MRPWGIAATELFVDTSRWVHEYKGGSPVSSKLPNGRADRRQPHGRFRGRRWWFPTEALTFDSPAAPGTPVAPGAVAFVNGRIVG